MFRQYEMQIKFPRWFDPVRSGLSWVLAVHQLPIIGAVATSFLLACYVLTPWEEQLKTGLLFIHAGLFISLLMLLRQAILVDISSRYDSLTGLSGRQHFLKRLDNRLRRNSSLVLLIMDLDKFKLVNDTLGHAAGDDLLVLVAEKFRVLIPELDIIARLGDDEFAVILEPSKLHCKDGNLDKAVEEVCHRLVRSFEGQMTVRGYDVDVGISIGSSIFPTHARTASELLRCADVAMYAAKKRSNGYCLYSEVFDTNNPENLRLLGSVRAAVELNQFILLYQPQKCFHCGKITSVEALIRWNHPTLGLLTPDKFIPMCEQTLVMRDITSWVIRTAVAQAAKWRAEGIDLEVSVNISTTDLTTSSLVPTVMRTLEMYNQQVVNFTMEVTETAVICDLSESAVIMATLHNIGIKFSIDDYGTGHTSLGYLKHLPISEIKIDRSFVTNIRDYHIVQSTIELAHDLQFSVIAEGVETKEVHDVLLALGCDFAQGWYVSRPCPPDNITRAYLSRIETLTSSTGEV